MKLILGILLLCVTTYAYDGRHVVFSGAAPLSNTYAAANLITSEMFSLKHLRIRNYTQNSMVCKWTPGDQAGILNAANKVPATMANGQEGQHLVLAASELVDLRDFYPSPNMWCRGENGPITSGDLFVFGW